jgi:hypothetical protein
MGLFDDISKKISTAAEGLGKLGGDSAPAQSPAKEPVVVSSVEPVSVDSKSITSIGGLESFVSSLESGASPAVMLALKSQMQVLQYVQSPTMTMMAIDNVLTCLYKSLQSAGTDKEKEALRDSYSSLIQSFIFVNEAQLRYEIEEDKQETINLLSQAGNMLSSSVQTVASMATGGVMDSIPKIANVLAKNDEQDNFLGKLIKAKGKKEMIEEKKRSFDETLMYIFETLGNYAQLIGPSIQLHGMLKRYADGLVKRYQSAQYESAIKKLNGNDISQIEALLGEEALQNKEKGSAIVGGVKTLFKMVSDVVAPTVYDYEALNEVKTKLENNLKGYEAQIEKLSSDIETARTELEQSSSFNFSRNSKLKGIIESSEVEKNKRKQLVLDCRQRIELIDKITEPIKDGIVQFETKLRNIVDKFEFVI